MSLMARRRVISLIVGMLMISGSLPAEASQGGSGSSGSSGSGSSGSGGSSSSGSGSSGSSSGSGGPGGSTSSGSGGSGASGPGSGGAPRTTVQEHDQGDDHPPDSLAPSTTGVTRTTPPLSVPAPPPTQITLRPTVPNVEEQHVVRVTACAKLSLSLDVRSDAQEIRIRTAMKPKSQFTWTAIILQDRRIAWKGAARRGEVDQRIANLAGSEVIAVRMSNPQGAVCTAEIVLSA